MSKRFIVEIEDNTYGAQDVAGVLYIGTKSDEIPGELMNMKVLEVTEILEENKRADGTLRMTTKQRDALWDLCGRYNVPFRENDYKVEPRAMFGFPPGFAEGWVGGELHNGFNNMKQTIYVGVDPEGRINS